MQNTTMQGSTPAAHQTEGTSEQASAGLSRLSDTAQQTMERFTHAASEAATRLSARGEELLNSPTAEKAKTYMREHPAATIGIAVAVGLVLSKLLSRRR
jgi:ElaB/YqjD/DUF883 family membrane-anchored ribosome-binding protein